MALPADWNGWDQHRMSKLDRELMLALQTVRKSIVAAKAVKQRFTAQNLSARWPTLATDYVHTEYDAQTRQEQTDAGNLVDFLAVNLLGEGTTTINAAQAVALLAKYANG
jgi:hypothetical protein